MIYAPKVATGVSGVERGGVHRLQRRVVLVRIGIGRLHDFRGAGQCGFHVARLVADKGLLGGEAFLEEVRDRGAGDLGVVALVPGDGQASSAFFARHQ